LIPGILPSTPAGPSTSSMFASASCLRVKTAALNRSPISPIFLRGRRALRAATAV